MVSAARFRKTEVARLAGRDQVLHRAPRRLDRTFGSDAVLVEKIDGGSRRGVAASRPLRA